MNLRKWLSPPDMPDWWFFTSAMLVGGGLAVILTLVTFFVLFHD